MTRDEILEERRARAQRQRAELDSGDRARITEALAQLVETRADIERQIIDHQREARAKGREWDMDWVRRASAALRVVDGLVARANVRMAAFAAIDAEAAAQVNRQTMARAQERASRRARRFVRVVKGEVSREVYAAWWSKACLQADQPPKAEG